MPKNLVLCFDGTHNQIGPQDTNVLRIHRCLARDDEQAVFYDPGVGTLTDPNSLTKVRGLVQEIVDMAAGVSLCDNVTEGYLFLMRNYRPGDRIFLFGFSRGAYTAKALAGILHMFGLLLPEYENLVPYVWQTYSDQKRGLPEVAEIYRTSFSYDALSSGQRSVRIAMLGLWDTVSSYGLFWDFKTLRHTRRNPSVDVVRHALALNEKRAMFKANHCQPAYEGQDVLEVWFAGYHSDVGGHPNPRPELSDIAFHWMAGEASAQGVRFDPARFADIPKGETVDPRPCLHDSMDWYWKIAEFLPIFTYSSRTRTRKLRMPNLFRPRPTLASEHIHESVADWVDHKTYFPRNLHPGMPVAITKPTGPATEQQAEPTPQGITIATSTPEDRAD